MSAGVAQAYLSFKAFGFGPQPRAHSLDEHFLRIVDDLMSLLWHFAPFRHNAVHARQYFPYDSTHLRDLLSAPALDLLACPRARRRFRTLAGHCQCWRNLGAKRILWHAARSNHCVVHHVFQEGVVQVLRFSTYGESAVIDIQLQRINPVEGGLLLLAPPPLLLLLLLLFCYFFWGGGSFLGKARSAQTSQCTGMHRCAGA